MREADNAADLASEGDAADGARTGSSKAVYELTGLLVHIMDEAEAPVLDGAKAKNRPPAEQEGTVVAHIRVRTYLQQPWGRETGGHPRD